MLKVVIHHAQPVKWFGQNLFGMEIKALFNGRCFRIRMKSLVSKENVVPSREGSETQKFGIKRVGKDQISPEKKIFVRTKG